jgi:hypothetical protein
LLAHLGAVDSERMRMKDDATLTAERPHAPDLESAAQTLDGKFRKECSQLGGDAIPRQGAMIEI